MKTAPLPFVALFDQLGSAVARPVTELHSTCSTRCWHGEVGPCGHLECV